ncbi:MAG: hypothetical protein ACOCWD_03420 [Tangfeifania sp.]
MNRVQVNPAFTLCSTEVTVKELPVGRSYKNRVSQILHAVGPVMAN